VHSRTVYIWCAPLLKEALKKWRGGGAQQEIFPARRAGHVPPLPTVFIDRRLNSVGLLFRDLWS